MTTTWRRSSILAGGYPIPVINGKDYGLRGDGAVDDTSGIQRALDAAVAAGGGYVYLPRPPVAYKITSGLTIGNGGAGIEATAHGVGLIGDGSGVGPDYSTTLGQVARGATRLLWAGAQDAVMVTVAGPVHHVRLSGLLLDGANLIGTGFKFLHAAFGMYEDLAVAFYRQVAFDFQTHATLAAGVLYDCSDNVCDAFYAMNPVLATAIGLRLNGTATGSLVSARNTFRGGALGYGGAAGGAGVELIAAVGNLFLGMRLQHRAGDTGAQSIKFTQPVSDATKPRDNVFVAPQVSQNVGGAMGSGGNAILGLSGSGGGVVASMVGLRTLHTPAPFAEFAGTTAAIAANTRSGDLKRFYAATTQTDQTSKVVPTGQTLKILSASVRARSGATAGTYTVKAQLKNISDTLYTDLATATGTASTDLRATAQGTRESPIATLAAGKVWNLVLLNDTTSPGALASQDHVVDVVAVYD
jgi:hypothetical protein